MNTPVRLTVLALASLLFLAPRSFADDEPVAPTKPTPEQGADAPAQPEDAPAKPEDVPAGKASTTPLVKLLSNGAEPRAEVRYAPAANSKLDFSVEITSDVTSPMGQMKIGPIKTTIRMAYAKGEKPGALQTAAEVTAASLEADASNPYAGQMRQGVEAMKGTKLAGMLSDCGLWKPVPSEAQPTPLQDSLQGNQLTLIPPLPTEPVGVGAKWTVSARISVNGVGQTSVVTAELTKVEGTRLHLTLTEVRSAKDEQMEMMGQMMPIKSVAGQGKGTAVIDLALGGVVKAANSIETDLVMDMMGNEMKSKSITATTITAQAPAAVTETDK